MENKDRHNMAQCSKCQKVMRSDKLRRHMKTHTKKEDNLNVIKSTNMDFENSNTNFEMENKQISNFENKKMSTKTIEDELILDGVNYRFIDTAGIRTTKDKI